MTQADDVQARNAHVITEFRANHDHPDWYRNLTTRPGPQIEVGDRVIGVRATELHSRERDDRYAEQARRYPGFAAYQQSTARTIPVIALTPVSRDGEADSTQEDTR